MISTAMHFCTLDFHKIHFQKLRNQSKNFQFFKVPVAVVIVYTHKIAQFSHNHMSA